MGLARMAAGGKRAKSGPLYYSDANLARVLTGAKKAECLPTADAHDAAHCARDPAGLLMPAAINGRPLRVPGAKPRLYHPSQMASRGVGWDSAYDEWWETYKELTAAGVPLGGLVYSRQQDALTFVRQRIDDVRLRDVLHQRTRQRMTPGELWAERAASAMLAEARYGGLAEAGETWEGDE